MELFFIVAFIFSLFLGIMAMLYSLSVGDLLRYLEKKHPQKWQTFGSPIPFSWYGATKGIRVLKFIFAQDNFDDPILAQKSQRANTLFIVILVSMLLLILSFILLIMLSLLPAPTQQIPSSKSNRQADSSSLEPKEIEGWQTYRNEEFGFEVKYPADWRIEEEINSKIYLRSPHESVILIAPVGFPGGSSESVNRKKIEGEIGGEHVLVDSHLTEDGIEWEKIIKFSEYSKSWKSGNFILAQVRFLSLEKVCAVPITPEHPECGAGDGLLYIGQIDLDEKRISDQILSTFRFVDQKPAIPKDKQTCESRGGTWGKFGLAQVELCNLPTSDAGKQCTDSSQCESACITDDNNLFDVETKGYCYGWTEFLGTCLNYVNNGKAQGTLCAD